MDVQKRVLGERGPVWWADDAPDENRRLVDATRYAEWYRSAMLSRANDQLANRDSE